MLIVYGSRLCKDCVACLADFDRVGVPYEYRDFSENLAWLKTFLAIRDTNPIFENSKRENLNSTFHINYK